MSTTHDDVLTGQSVADGLREVADWLEEHPEIPAVQFAFVRVGAKTREDLERLAAALDNPSEREAYGPAVEIEGRFTGDVRVYGQVDMAKLAGVPVKPAYTPILPQQARARKLRERGLTIEEIAEGMGVSPWTVRAFLGEGRR
ncbi:MAG TPA: helix-turn-helix transcriptional regulator [Solirubrobacteraceae bacterium]|nr:helix-turn-helix transcriptional regulator [Solirubrobacteraceae bacterium]